MTIFDEMAEAIHIARNGYTDRSDAKHNYRSDPRVKEAYTKDAQAAYAVLEKKIGKEALEALLAGGTFVTMPRPKRPYRDVP